MSYLILLSPLFMWQNLFYLRNYSRLDLPFEQRKSHKFLDLVYYWIKLLFPIWLISILLTFSHWSIFVMLLLSVIRFPLYHVNKKSTKFLLKLSPIINIILLIISIYQFIIS